MKKIDTVIENIKSEIRRQELLMANLPTKEGQKNIYKNKIAELEYRIKELEEQKKGNSFSLAPEYGDGKYASYYYKEAFDMLRVCYYHYFHQDPTFSPVSKWRVMFYDSTLSLPVNTYLVKGKIPFQIMYSTTYPRHQSNASSSISIELPFEVLSKQENEDYLACMLELIKIYSGDGINLVFGNGLSTRATLSYIAEKDINLYFSKDLGYYEFFEKLCDNNVRNIIYIGDSMKKGISPKTIKKVKSDFVDLHRKLTASGRMKEEELKKSNETIKQHILSIRNRL